METNATNRTCAVGAVREEPSGAPAPTVEHARALHRAHGFPRPRGAGLSGPRCVVEYGQEGYPEALMTVKSPPPRLYVVGDVAALQDGLAIVGARKATPYGLSCARRFAQLAAEAGVCVVSGGARGCDGAAHRAALQAGGTTVVVLGSGCDEVYPAEHLPLFQEVVERGGAVVSEQEWGFPPLPYVFRARNRIIAGLARAVLVTEAGVPSGTMSTVDDALAAGKEVYAVPGSILSPTSLGCNRLIAQGAVPIVDDGSFQDALFATFGCLRQERAPTAQDGGEGAEGQARPADERTLLSALVASPATAEELSRLACRGLLDLAPGRIACALATLESEGALERRRDGRYAVVLR